MSGCFTHSLCYSSFPVPLESSQEVWRKRCKLLTLPSGKMTATYKSRNKSRREPITFGPHARPAELGGRVPRLHRVVAPIQYAWILEEIHELRV